MSPVLGFVLLLLLVIGMAGTANFMIQQQQQVVEDKLGNALEQDLDVGSVSCFGDRIKMTMDNKGADLSDVSEARMTVIKGGTVQGDMINQTVPFNGAFTRPNSTGTLNASIRGTFISGEIYTVRLSFPFGEYVKEGTCNGGYDWWNTDYRYRQQLRLTNNDQAVTGDEIEVELDTTDQVTSAMMRSDCADLQVVDDNETITISVSDCGTTSTTVSFPISLDADEKRVSTYLYYGYPGARGSPPASSSQDDTVTIDVGQIEEQ